MDAAELEEQKITAMLKRKAGESIQPIPTLYLNYTLLHKMSIFQVYLVILTFFGVGEMTHIDL